MGDGNEFLSFICWIAEGIDNSVDLRCQTASTTAYFLFQAPLLRRPHVGAA
jgi:hypothetical protein